jgi:hypothetical protein
MATAKGSTDDEDNPYSNVVDNDDEHCAAPLQAQKSTTSQTFYSGVYGITHILR